MEGTPFGRYRLIELLGRGGMGEVWRAHDTNTDRIVAVKVLPAQLAADPNFEQRFRREAHAAARLHHPHIVPIHDYGEIDGRLYVDMALIDGHDLAGEITTRPLPPERAVTIIEQIARALQAAHKAGLVHRDVKPSNILIDDEDNAYLIDFGIARAATDSALTGTGNTLGTFNYMAPERFTTDDVDHRSDIYALTCVLYEALTGTRTFPGDTLERQFAGHLNTPPPRPSDSGLSPTFDTVIATGLAKDPGQRYQNAKNLAVAARAALGAPASANQPTPPVKSTAAPAESVTDIVESPTTSISAPPVSAWQGPPTEHIAWPKRPPAAAPQPLAPKPSRRNSLLLGAGAILLIAVMGIVVSYLTGGSAGDQNTNTLNSGGDKNTNAFNKAVAGDCLTWDTSPDHATIVDCSTDHLFEVAKPIDLSILPGSEFGPDAAPPTPSRIQQIVAEQCDVAVRDYLGPHFDPDSRYTVSMLWPGEDAWRSSGDRRMLCGLQLPGENGKQLTFAGKIADGDQSKVWPVGTCLGISPTTNQSTDSPVDCGTAHAAEITGIVDLSQQFPAGAPDDAAQDSFIKEQCTKLTDAYLAPVQLRNTTLTLMYKTISTPSWSAGSHQVACSIGATLGNGGWSTLVNSAKGNLLVNGQPPAP